MLPGLTYEGSSSFQSIFQAEMERNIGFNKIADFIYIKCICANTLVPSFAVLGKLTRRTLLSDKETLAGNACQWNMAETMLGQG